MNDKTRVVYSSRRIKEVVADVTGATISDLMNPSNRSQENVLARQVATIVLRDKAEMSWPRIATAIGDTSHSSSHTRYARFKTEPSQMVRRYVDEVIERLEGEHGVA